MEVTTFCRKKKERKKERKKKHIAFSYIDMERKSYKDKNIVKNLIV